MSPHPASLPLTLNCFCSYPPPYASHQLSGPIHNSLDLYEIAMAMTTSRPFIHRLAYLQETLQDLEHDTS